MFRDSVLLLLLHHVDEEPGEQTEDVSRGPHVRLNVHIGKVIIGGQVRDFTARKGIPSIPVSVSHSNFHSLCKDEEGGVDLLHVRNKERYQSSCHGHQCQHCKACLSASPQRVQDEGSQDE